MSARKVVAIRSRTWRRYGEVLDQGNLGSCTGNAMVHALNSKPNHRVFTRTFKEDLAVALYSAATKIDPFDGYWPPTDTGSSALAVAKAAQARGLITSYQHAFGLDHVLEALMSGPVMIGTNWHEGMFHPDSKGFVKPTGNPAGGHEYLLVGVDVKRRVLTFQNSWGKGWGVKGRFHMTFDDFDLLLKAWGDALIPVR